MVSQMVCNKADETWRSLLSPYELILRADPVLLASLRKQLFFWIGIHNIFEKCLPHGNKQSCHAV